ncbi:MAG: glycosyltransferase family 2 protein [Gemmatimonadota bacterium]|nr:glycosyltransferase family 2 protein [Gemmatimonadota bacterium]
MPDSVENLVSAIIPVYNRGDLLREAVGSVLAQTHRPIEIIIVDDGSTDDTTAVCAELATAHPDVIRSVRQENGGPGLARETGRQLARGEFIQYLDSDDLLAPQKFEKQIEALRLRPDCGVAYCKAREYNIGELPRDEPLARTGEDLLTLFPSLLSGPCWQTSTPLYRRTLCDQVGPWTDLGQEEDWEYDARVGALGTRLVWCREFLADYRHHTGFRARGNSMGNPRKMRWRYRSHVLIYQHARRAGVDSANPHMQRYARELLILSRQCRATQLEDEARTLFNLSREASGTARSRRINFGFYRLVTASLRWNAPRAIARWIDRVRSR